MGAWGHDTRHANVAIDSSNGPKKLFYRIDSDDKIAAQPSRRMFEIA